MLSLKNEKLQEQYRRKMESALMKGDFKSYESIKKQYNELLNYREKVPASEITKQMKMEDRERCNKLLRKIPVLADIAESSAVDLQELLKKYDDSVTLPMLEEIRQLKYLSQSIRKIIDKVGNLEFQESFGDICDKVNDLIESVFCENSD